LRLKCIKNIIDFKYIMPPKNSGMSYAAAVNKKMQAAKKKSRRKKVFATNRGKLTKYKPRVDKVITRTFKYIFRTNEISNPFPNNTDCYIGNDNNAIFARSFFFNSAEIPGFNAFVGPTGPFTHYRIDKITYKFMSVGTTVLVDDTDGNGQTEVQRTQPMIFWTTLTGAERRGEQSYQSVDQAVFDSWKSCKCGQDFTISFTPNNLTYFESQRQSTGANITNPVLVPKRNQWLCDRFDYQQSGNAIGTNFYGIKLLIDSTSAAKGEYLYKIYVNVKASFKGTADNSNQSIGDATFNHRIYAA